MIDYTELRRTIEVFISSNFSDVPVRFENTFLTKEDEEHISILDSGDLTSEPLEMGMGAPSLMSGLLTIEIFTYVGKGTQKARQIASSLDTIFNDSIDGITFDERELRSVGVENDAPFYKHVLNVPYKYFYGQNDSN
jgi:hypothetical protein